jgi:hypothetical protein
MRVWLVTIAIAALSGAWPSAGRLPQAVAPSTRPALSDADTERFLREAKIVKTKAIGKGVTGSIRATLSDGTLTHDAQIQTVDEKKTQFNAPGAAEFNFEDSWRFNVAAYRLDRMIGLNMVPVSVARNWRTSPAAVTWWVDDVMMDEGKRLKDKLQPPNGALWNEQMQLVRIFDQLIYNVDRNVGNLLIGNTWRLWAIDHTRAFRTHDTLKSPANITRCDRQMLAGLKALNREELKRSIGDFVSDYQIKGLLARRDKIVAIIEQGGPTAVFDRHPHSPGS